MILMRFKNALRNSAVAFAGQLLNIFLGFGVRTLFIRYLSQEFLGVNGIMESLIMLLSVTELGIGTSVAFALYSPINDNDERRIAGLMGFYKRIYRLLGVITLVLGLAIMPFMHFFTKDAASVPDINIIYFLFLANTVLSYFFAYKRTLISAHQEHYINSLSDDLFAVLKYVIQAVILIVFKNYIGYLAVNLVCTFLSNAVISFVCDKRHPIAEQYKNERLTDSDKKLLQKSVISLMYQKVAGKLVTGTDNLMISYVNIALMGIYSNYSMIIGIIDRVIGNVMKALTGSVGNLMVQKDGDYKYSVYEEFVFSTFCLFFVISSALAGCLERFIVFWAGDDWVLSPLVTFVVVMNFFFQGTRNPNIAVIDTAGIFNKIRPKAVVEVVVNLVVSFLFLIVFEMGIYGVLFGTTISKIGVCVWWEAWAVHKYSFEKTLSAYIAKYLKNTVITALGCFASYFACRAIPVYGFMGLVLSGIISVAISVTLILAFYFKTTEFHSVKMRVKNNLR